VAENRLGVVEWHWSHDPYMGCGRYDSTFIVALLALLADAEKHDVDNRCNLSAYNHMIFCFHTRSHYIDQLQWYTDHVGESFYSRTDCTGYGAGPQTKVSL